VNLKTILDNHKDAIFILSLDMTAHIFIQNGPERYSWWKKMWVAVLFSSLCL